MFEIQKTVKQKPIQREWKKLLALVGENKKYLEEQGSRWLHRYSRNIYWISDLCIWYF